jgi:cytochrome c-type biogenesis protein CcmF
VAGYHLTLKEITPLKGPNYAGKSGHFEMTRNGVLVRDIVSEKRTFQPSGMPTTEVGLDQTIWGDIYVVLGDDQPDGGHVVRASFNPLASFIWLGAAIMFAGGLLSLSDRRLRIGVPHAAAKHVLQAAE